MPVNLKGRSLLTLKDFTPDEIRYLLNLAADLKAKKRAGIPGDLLAGKNIVLLFEKTSTRTRCAFEVAALDEGAHVTFLSNSQMGKKESLEDTAKVLGRFYDGIEFRGFKQETVEPRKACGRSRMERPHRPVSSHSGSCRLPHHHGKHRQAPQQGQARLCR